MSIRKCYIVSIHKTIVYSECIMLKNQTKGVFITYDINFFA
ncbi:hypothetical protein HMPREF3182_00839 [Megasphaera hutchinsoni]|uniref:Uncharacterized protein n=1 Tax=Megasphaera hutchinsoni TaxID=1588748 RepID=A0A134CGV4_9FIRM|nr:hypothetical protein HMPREF3182_00839 [Megasphaera hutchinsoni]